MRMLDTCNDMLTDYLAHVSWYLLHDAIDKYDFVHGDGAIVASRHDLLLNKTSQTLASIFKLYSETWYFPIGVLFHFVSG